MSKSIMQSLQPLAAFVVGEEMTRGYDTVDVLYPYVRPLSHWRAWEYAAYQKSALMVMSLILMRRWMLCRAILVAGGRRVADLPRLFKK